MDRMMRDYRRIGQMLIDKRDERENNVFTIRWGLFNFYGHQVGDMAKGKVTELLPLQAEEDLCHILGMSEPEFSELTKVGQEEKEKRQKRKQVEKEVGDMLDQFMLQAYRENLIFKEDA